MQNISKHTYNHEPVYKLGSTILNHSTHKDVQVRFPDGMETSANLLWREHRIPYHLYWTPFLKVVYHGLIVYLDFDDEYTRENILMQVL